MTNNELLHASLLDILFDGRNKEYGAYALRRNYNQRMLIAMGIGFSVIFLFLLLKSMMGNDSGTTSAPWEKNYEITVINLPDDKVEKLPDLPKPKPARAETPKPPEATVKNTTIAIVDDDKAANSEMPTVDDFDNKTSGLTNTGGDIGDKAVTPTPIEPHGNGSGEKMVAEDVPMKPSSAPEYPGGVEALKKFLGRNLSAPEELGLDAGERRMVKVRFVVGKDGVVSIIEVIETGGSIFDKEVVRVCKKMPKWKPAIQHGEPVTATYVLPVTFVGE
jgi:periplasmic protein TonB